MVLCAGRSFKCFIQMDSREHQYFCRCCCHAHMTDEDARDAERLHSLHLDHSNRMRSPSKDGDSDVSAVRAAF